MHAQRVASGLFVALGCAAGCGETLDVNPAKCVGATAVVIKNTDPAYIPAQARACAFSLSCPETQERWAYLRGAGQAPRSCLADWHLNGLDGTSCASDAKSCKEWLACASHGHCPNWCRARIGDAPLGLAWVCDESEVVVCDPFEHGGYGTPFTSCADGLRCEERLGSAACTDGTVCGTPSNAHCEGERIVACDSATLLGVSTDCASRGGQCTDFNIGVLSGAACVTAAPTCDLSYREHCDGDHLFFCAFGYVADVDCKLPPYLGTCGDVGGTPDCIPAASECTKATPDRCDGTRFFTCGSDQTMHEVDCTSLGFRSCGDVGGRVGCVK
jgi:hypothetical protein